MKKSSLCTWMLGVALMGPVACGGVDDPAPVRPTTPPATGGTSGTAAPTGFFTVDERDTITQTLGVLPEAPMDDPSNRFANHPGAASLGQKFYFETRYSSNGQVACATCHNPRQGFQDARAATSSGPNPVAFTGRHAPTVINGAYGSGDPATSCWNFWDGRADSQWAQALGPPESDVEMGGSRSGIVLLIHQHYKAEYESVFGDLPTLHDDMGAPLAPAGIKGGSAAWKALPESTRDAVNEVYRNFGKAIAAYERKVVSRNSKFDAFWAEFAAGKDSTILDEQEKLGLKVFVGKGLCTSCHRGANFTDWKFHNIGVSQRGANIPGADTGRSDGIAKAKGGEFSCTTKWSDHPDKTDCPVNKVAATVKDIGAFKTPSLRDISKTGPYMHTGALKTLAEVVEHYDQGGGTPGTYNGTLHKDIVKLHLTVEEKAALVKFMLALDGEPLPNAMMEAPALPGM
jgi:cytochrome c peroxidase